MPVPWTCEAAGIRLSVRLTPRAAKDSLDGRATLSDGRSVLAARVRALPEKGAANAALERLLAKALDLAPSSVNVTAGSQSRLKSVRLEGDAAAIELALLRLFGRD
jgi:uncharacterized protein YggU (UPF0235/DUF167 family)